MQPELQAVPQPHCPHALSPIAPMAIANNKIRSAGRRITPSKIRLTGSNIQTPIVMSLSSNPKPGFRKDEGKIPHKTRS
jgi:hypothetical protein